MPDGTAICSAWSSNIEVDFDVTVTGFDLAEIDILIEELSPNEDDLADELIEPVSGPAVTRPGDIWQIGDQADLRRFIEARNLPGSAR